MNPEQWLSLKWNGGSTMSDRWLNQSKIIQITNFENNLVTLAGQYKIPVSQKRAVEVKKQFLNMFIK